MKRLSPTKPASGPAGGGLWNFRCLIFLSAIFLLGSSVNSLRAQPSREYQIKAVFLYNFAQFIDWPQTAFADTNSPLVIGVLGIDPFGRVLDDTVMGETVRGRRLVVQRYRRVEDIKTCHILFISQSETRQIEAIVNSFRGKPTLTVADADLPPSSGVIIRFTVENNKVHFRINQDAARTANLTLSSKLLRVAEFAPGGPP
jgi:hypothetical protein